jgi:tRNA A-37 threonylcarbamoyl transferase component Bud32
LKGGSSVAIFDSFNLSTDADFEALMARFGVARLASGAQRTVYSLGSLPFVVKVDDHHGDDSKYRDSRLADGNKKEAAAYARAVEAGLAQHTAAVIAVSDSGKYLLMEKVDTAAVKRLRPKGAAWGLNELGQSLRRRFTRMFEPLGVEGDFHAGNIGRKGNRWVVIDMGIAL